MKSPKNRCGRLLILFCRSQTTGWFTRVLCSSVLDWTQQSRGRLSGVCCSCRHWSTNSIKRQVLRRVATETISFLECIIFGKFFILLAGIWSGSWRRSWRASVPSVQHLISFNLCKCGRKWWSAVKWWVKHQRSSILLVLFPFRRRRLSMSSWKSIHPHPNSGASWVIWRKRKVIG